MAQIKKSNSLYGWFDQRLGLTKLFENMLSRYWIAKNINFLWAMGVLLLVLFTLLFVSGLMLAMYYKPDAALAFDSVNKTIMQEVKYGWLWRHIHAVSASIIFLIMYIHTFTAIYYRSYKSGREMIWITGMLLFICFSAEAFSGYMLPWGQMSYWAAKVITGLFEKIPVIGPNLTIWIRGDYSVSDPTLTRFFMFHVCLLPVILIFMIAVHLYSIRIPHTNNLEGENLDFELEAEKYLDGKKKESKVVPFWPAFLSKDFFYIAIFMIFFFYLVGFHYQFAMDPINFQPANYSKTPTHIYPEWYFLWQYEVLRGFFFDIGSIKGGNLGLIAFAFAGISLFLLPWLDRSSVVMPARKNKAFFVWFWVLLIDLVVLTIFGKLPPTIANNYVGFFASITYITLILVALPIITIIEKRSNQ